MELAVIDLALWNWVANLMFHRGTMNRCLVGESVFMPSANHFCWGTLVVCSSSINRELLSMGLRSIGVEPANLMFYQLNSTSAVVITLKVPPWNFSTGRDGA